MKGVVILTLGHAYWGRWAYNLAMSLKYQSPDINISLLYAGEGINQIQDTTLFDKFIEIPEKYYLTNAIPTIRTIATIFFNFIIS